MNEEQVQEKKPIIAITHGDINGVSYEIILKALNECGHCEKYIPVIYGSPKVAAYYKKVLEINEVDLTHIPSIDNIEKQNINIINCVSNKVKVEIGRSTEMAGQSSLNALRHAVVDIKNKKTDILVTAPINKNNIQSNDFSFKGHTDFFKSEFGVEDVLMFMISDRLKIALVTEHVAINEVAASITKEKILSKIRLMEHSLRRDFGITRPRIAVLGLNPHIGDSGIIGKEDDEIVIPAIEAAKEENILAFGPFSADGFFGYENYQQFDAILAMYHDQGLIPFKLLVNGGGVNFTAGLPIVRTSPAHGTAYEIAGRNVASPKSMQEAIEWALKIYYNRQFFDNIIPLKTDKSQHELEVL